MVSFELSNFEFSIRLTMGKSGRYSTGSNLNTYSALIQNFYSQETAPHQAVHVALNTGVEEGEEAGVKAYVRCVRPACYKRVVYLIKTQLSRRRIPQT